MPGTEPTVLVAGGAGYIGSHVCKALAHAGLRPVVYDNLSQGHYWAVRWGPFEHGDLADAERLDQVIARYRPIAAMHFAAFISAGESVAEPDKYYRNNVVGLLGLLEAMRRHGIDRIVFSSSAAVYGTPARVPIVESDPLLPINPYGASKAMCERVLQDFAAAYGIRSVSLRYFNAAGADPEGELGEEHEPETHLIPLVLQAAAGRGPGVTIFGDTYPTRDGTCARDYIHVSDLAMAHVLALRRTGANEGAIAYNLGNGHSFTVREVIRAARRVTGAAIPTRVRDPRPGDPPVLLADAQRARIELGWRPAYTDLETQLSHAWAWIRRGGRKTATGTETSERLRSGHHFSRD